MLEVRDLHVRIAEREILKGVNLVLPRGEVHAVMGRNGSGKSTLSYVLAGKEDYEITSGEVLLDGISLLELEPSERATAGLFLAFQYPIEIPGVATMTFLKAAMNAQLKARERWVEVEARWTRTFIQADPRAVSHLTQELVTAAKVQRGSLKDCFQRLQVGFGLPVRAFNTFKYGNWFGVKGENV